MHVRLIPFLALASAAFFQPAFSQSGDEPGGEKFGSELADRLSRFDLPFTGDDSDLSLDIHPKFGDIIHDQYIRLPLSMTYSPTQDREIDFGIIPYFENPLDGEPESSKGYLTFGLKQRINQISEDRLNFALGMDVKIPLEQIPSDLQRDSFDEFAPYLTAAYRLDDRGRYLLFSNLRYQMVGKNRGHITEGLRDPRSLAVFRPGVIYQPQGEFGYSLQLEYKTDRIDGGSDDGVKIIPGIIWNPPEDTPFFKSLAGHFEITLNIEYALSEIAEEAAGNDIGIGLEVNWRLIKRRSEPEDKVL